MREFFEMEKDRLKKKNQIKDNLKILFQSIDEVKNHLWSFWIYICAGMDWGNDTLLSTAD